MPGKLHLNNEICLFTLIIGLVFILLCLYLICAEYEFETFGSTSDQIRLMALIQTL